MGWGEDQYFRSNNNFSDLMMVTSYNGNRHIALITFNPLHMEFLEKPFTPIKLITFSN